MPKVLVNGVNLYYEEAGSGAALIFLHEFAGDYRSWEPQMRYFARRYRCITLSYRGYPPSDVPDDPDAYSQDILLDDVVGLMDALDIGKAHICGLSIGANTAVFLGMRNPERCLSLVVAGGGHGSVKEGVDREEFEHDFTSRAERLLTEGMEPVARMQAEKPSRLPMKMKDPRGWAEFRDWLIAHDPRGSAHMALGVPLKRPNYYDIEQELGQMDVPTLIIVGDQDGNCLEGSLFLKHALPRAGLFVFPMSGHLLPVEEPDLFNRAVADFLTLAEAGKWAKP
jgi:pimeloyl-ACP methyl ester carboxylesterase